MTKVCPDGSIVNPAAVAVGEDWVQPVAYVAGPYRSERGTFWVEQNIRNAERVAVELWRMGYAVICPHANTRHFDGALGVNDTPVYLRGDLTLLRRSDVVILMDRWKLSEGAKKERTAAAVADILTLEWDRDSGDIHRIGLVGRQAVALVKAERAARN